MISSLLSALSKLHDESTLRERIRANLNEWASELLEPLGLTPRAHHRILLSCLDRIATGELRRLLVLMPPGSAKSTYTSVVFPIWWFIQHPRSSIIAVSCTSSLVEHFSRQIIGIVEENPKRVGFSLKSGDRSASHWRTTTGGEYFAAGVRGTVIGRRADIVIVDDPVRSMAEADNPRHRRHLWEWYSSELISRLKPGGRIVVVMTRWHEQDLAGRLLDQDPGGWHVLRLPALAEPGDPMGRPLGAALWPEWESAEALEQKRAVVGPRVWAALFQQSPQGPEDRLFEVGRIGSQDPETHRSPVRQRTVRAWDLAATAASGENNPDWTVGVKLSHDERGAFVVEDVVRLREDWGHVREVIVSTARSDGHSVVVGLPIDPGQAGKAQVGAISSSLVGYRVFASRESGTKWSRALPVASQIAAGNVSVRKGAWNREFFDELRAFPGGEKDDQVDALSRAMNTLSEFPESGRRLFVPFNLR